MEIKSDWWAVVIDETEYWDIPEKFKGKLLRIGTEYFYDRNLVTHICSIQIHYLLHPLDSHVELSDEALNNEELREEILTWVDDGWHSSNNGGDYFLTGQIDSIPDEDQEAYGEVIPDEDETEEETVRMGWSENCPRVSLPKRKREVNG